nr:hypothetical protein [Tanacetum cinerariifolium]
PNFASVFQFNNKATKLETEVVELKKDDLLNTQVTTLVDEHLDSRLGATKDEFMSYLSASITPRITKQHVTESLEHVVLTKESSQRKSTYEAAASLTEFKLKKILINKIDESQSYLTTTEHRECYDGLIKSYNLDKSLFSTYDKRNQSLRLHIFEMPQDQEVNLGDEDEEPKKKVVSTREWFTKPKQSQEPTDPDWNVSKTLQQGPTQSWFSDEILIWLRTSLDDITKNIRMEYLPQRRWSTLEKKKAHIVIKAIDKQLKERRMMRSFEKFVGGRHYETDLWLLQRI